MTYFHRYHFFLKLDQSKFHNGSLFLAGNMIDWIYVEYYNEKSPSKYSIARLADTALAMMKFVVTFRDLDIQIARGEKVAA